MNKKILITVIAVPIVFIVIFSVVLIWNNSKKQTNLISEEVNVPQGISGRVYSVAEVSHILEEDPEVLKNKSIKIRAYVASMVAGLGCEDFFILTDFEDGKLYDSQYDSDLTQEERIEIQKKVRDIPMITTGQTLALRAGDFYPTVYAIYEGHFYDEWATKECMKGNGRFVIDRKIEEIVPDVKFTSLKETINSGCLVKDGKLIYNPLEVTLRDTVIRVNGVLYEPSTEDMIGRITLETDNGRVMQYDNLLRSLRADGMVVYGGDRYETTNGDCGVGKLIAINDVVESNKSKTQKKDDLEDLIWNSAHEDIFLNWSLDKESLFSCPSENDLYNVNHIECIHPITKKENDYCHKDYKEWIINNCEKVVFEE